jgi:hypothetical protein
VLTGVRTKGDLGLRIFHAQYYLRNSLQFFIIAVITSGLFIHGNAWPGTRANLIPKKRAKLVRLTVKTERCAIISGGPRPESEPLATLNPSNCPSFSANFIVLGDCLNPTDLSTCRFRTKFRSGITGVSQIQIPIGIYHFHWTDVPPLGGCNCSIDGANLVKISTSGERVTLRMNCKCHAP